MGICGFNHFKLCVKNLDKNPTVIWQKAIKNILSTVRKDTPYWNRYKSIFILDFRRNENYGTLPTKANSEKTSRNGSINEETISFETPEPENTTSFPQKSRFHRNSKSYDFSAVKDKTFSKLPEDSSGQTLLKALDLPLNLETSKSLIEKLRILLLSEISQESHVTHIFIDLFHKKFDQDFFRDLKFLNKSQATTEDVKKYRAISMLVKSFVEVTSKIIMFMHQDYVQQFESIIQEDFFEPRWVAETVIYEVLFKKRTSTLNKLVLGLLTKIHRNISENMNESFSQHQLLNCEELSSKSEVSSDIAFEDCSSLTIKEENNEALDNDVFGLELSRMGLYSRFDNVMNLEKKIFQHLTHYYQTEGKLIQNMSNKVCVESDIAIVRRYVEEIQKEAAIVDEEYVEEYIHKQYLDHIQIFRVFQGFHSSSVLFIK